MSYFIKVYPTREKSPSTPSPTRRGIGGIQRSDTKLTSRAKVTMNNTNNNVKIMPVSDEDLFKQPAPTKTVQSAAYHYHTYNLERDTSHVVEKSYAVVANMQLNVR